MIPSLKDRLSEIGLSKKEAAVLAVLLTNGSLSGSQIAKYAHINRTTTYGVLKNLQEEGLVSSTRGGAQAWFQSIAPELLPAYIERKVTSLHKTGETLAALIPSMQRLRKYTATSPKVQLFEGEDGVRQAYEDTLEHNQGKVLYDLTGTDAVFRRMGAPWVEYYTKKRARLGIRCIDISPDSAQTRASRTQDRLFLRTTKLLPAEYAFDTEIDLYDNKVAIFSFSEQEPVALIIEDDTIAHTMQTLFRYIESTVERT